MSHDHLSISDLVSSIKKNLESEYRLVNVVGEISNFSKSSQGHYYFNLSDNQASISCALFRMDVMRNPELSVLKEGDLVNVVGSISVYAKRGTFQIIVKKISKAGQGNLMQQFEQLKLKLSSEGLFDLERKKTIPQYPKKIAIITAIGGAALQDFLNVFLRRSFQANLVIVPAIVQGDQSANSLISALEKVEKKGCYDLVVLTRGGGSIEDLWSFNNERLVRKLSTFSIPVISAVGHQVDYTLCDYVSDLRCETPTAAAEIITQAQTQTQTQLNLAYQRSLTAIKKIQQDYMVRLSKLTPHHILAKMRDNLLQMRQKLEQLRLSDRYFELTGVYRFEQQLDEMSRSMIRSVESKFESLNRRSEEANQLLRVTNPNQVLSRGYSYLSTHDKVITSLKEFSKLESKTEVSVKFYDGKADLLVK